MTTWRFGFAAALLAIAVAPAHGQASGADDSLWTIRGGTFGGTAVRVDMRLATRRGSRFLRVSRLKGDGRFVGWNPSRLPAPVAFRPGKVDEEDSVAFWSIVRQMEADMGMRLFEPATIDRDTDPADVIVVDTKAMSAAEGMTLVTWSTSGGIYDARVFVAAGATLHDSRIVTHEMMHALGFGHTGAWTSIMNSGAGTPRRLTPADVAYAQLALESRAASERSDMWERLALVVSREDPSHDTSDGNEGCPDDEWVSFAGLSMTSIRGKAAPPAVTAIGACTDAPSNVAGGVAFSVRR